MDNGFKWNMFVTSFIPLWISILIIDIWHLVESIVCNWGKSTDIWKNILHIMYCNAVILSSILIIIIVSLLSITQINSFIKAKEKSATSPTAKIKKVVRANKLSSEFLLAYILPMIAFDFSELKSVVLFCIYFAVLAFLCIRNNNVYTNIFLEFKGYKMYICDLECGVMNNKNVYEECLVISKEDLIVEKENNIKYWDFDNYIYIDLVE